MMNGHDWELHFTLSRKVSCNSGVPKSHQDIDFELINETNSQTYITGFTISLTNLTDDEAKDMGQRLAKNFANYLSLSSGLPVDANLDGTRVKNDSGGHTVSKSFTVSYCIENIANLLIPDEQLLDIIHDQKSGFVQQMAYVCSAMKSLYANNPESAIKDLVLACNETPKDNLAKFRSLRNALSHKIVYPNDIQNIQKDFGISYFEFTSDDRFDHNSVKNKKHLLEQAQIFLTEVRNDILSIVK